MKVTDLIWLGNQLAGAGRAEAQLSAPGVPIAELIVMGDVLDHSPCSISEIATRTGYAQSRVSTAVTRVVARGWAVTKLDPADGRRTLVDVLPSTRKDARRHQRASQARSIEQLLANVPARRHAAVVLALEDLLTALRQAQ